MRWEAKKEPNIGETRYVRRFAFFPVLCKNQWWEPRFASVASTHYWVWFESYLSQEKYTTAMDHENDYFNYWAFEEALLGR